MRRTLKGHGGVERQRYREARASGLVRDGVQHDVGIMDKGGGRQRGGVWIRKEEGRRRGNDAARGG
jgi:hypothetical protein